MCVNVYCLKLTRIEQYQQIISLLQCTKCVFTCNVAFGKQSQPPLMLHFFIYGSHKLVQMTHITSKSVPFLLAILQPAKPVCLAITLQTFSKLSHGGQEHQTVVHNMSRFPNLLSRCIFISDNIYCNGIL